jgi:hypothetical protein
MAIQGLTLWIPVGCVAHSPLPASRDERSPPAPATPPSYGPRDPALLRPPRPRPPTAPATPPSYGPLRIALQPEVFTTTTQ